jgi:hypothetical protein
MYILLRSLWNFLQNRPYLGHKVSFNKYRKIEISPCILSDHNAIKRERNNERNSRKYSNTWRLNNNLLHDQWVIKDIGRKSQSSQNLMRMKAQPIRTFGTQQMLRGQFMAMNAYIEYTE